MLRDDDPSPLAGDFQRWRYIAQDANFNVIATMDSSGVVQDRFHYDAYGTPKFLTATAADAAEGGSDGLQHPYTSYFRESKSKMYDVRYRYLHPTLGGWLTRDPIGNLGGPAHRYQALRSDGPPGLVLDPAGTSPDGIDVEVGRSSSDARPYRNIPRRALVSAYPMPRTVRRVVFCEISTRSGIL